MKKIFLFLSALAFIGAVSATSVSDHNVTVDLEGSLVNVSMEVEEMSSSAYYYTSSFPVEEGLRGTVAGEEVQCESEPLPPGSYITCDVERSNFTMDLSYRTSGLVTERSGVSIFRYSQGIQRPTDFYRLKVLLPRGSGLAEDSNVSLPVVSPENGVSGTNGQRIYVKWSSRPDLGQVNYQAIFRPSDDVSAGGGGSLLFWLIPAVLVALVSAAVYLIYVSREEIDKAYDDLSEDEAEVLDMIRDNGNSMLQKDIVDESDYSKAKISSVISGLEEKDIVKKSKEGRSNMISISRRYKY